MSDDYIVIGQAGTGSVIVEAALELASLPYHAKDVQHGDFGDYNPMAQLPALITPSGELITESAAILIWLADAHPEAALAPAVGDPERAQFLRWMAFVASAIYALYWIRDEPGRIADEDVHKALARERTAERIAHCWSVMDSHITPAPFLAGKTLGVLDLYVAVISRWGPRRRRFYEVAPRMTEAVRRVDAEPRLAELWARRFPFKDGWEG
jgi:GST-like protein